MKLKLLIHIFLLVSFLNPNTTFARTGVLTKTGAGDLPGCVDFKWAKGPGGEEKAGMLVPVKINGKQEMFQLDTAAPSVYLYSTKPHDKKEAIVNVEIGGIKIDKFQAQLHDKNGDEGGTIGLDPFLGNILVIDFVQTKFCAFKPSEAPENFGKGSNRISGNMLNNKFYVPVNINGQIEQHMFYDSGSSLLPLLVYMPLWQQLTGLQKVEDATKIIKGNSWGNEVSIYGAPIKGDVKIGKISLMNEFVYFVPSMDFYEVEQHGLFGNQPFFDKTIALDLTSNMQFLIFPNKTEQPKK